MGPHKALLQKARLRQADPDWKADYRATRPKVERKFGHLMFHRHGGRRARVRGLVRVGQGRRHACAQRPDHHAVVYNDLVQLGLIGAQT